MNQEHQAAGPSLEPPNHWAEFIGGPVDGQKLAIARPYPQFGFVIDGQDWIYKLVLQENPLRYEFVGANCKPGAIG
jgi:hypothetical protein